MYQQRNIELQTQSLGDRSKRRDEDDNLSKLAGTIWRRRSMIGLLTLIFLAFGVFYLSFTSPRYTATTTMIIDTKRVPLFQGDLYSESQVDDSAVQSQVETIRSENVAVAVIRKLKLTEDSEFIGLSGRFRRYVQLLFGGQQSAAEVDDGTLRRAINVLRDNLKVARVAKSYVVDIQFTSYDPNKAAAISNAVADAYIDDQFLAKFEVTKRASAWLQQRIGELKSQATDAFRKIQDFKSTNNLIISDGKLSTDRELEELTNSLAKARAQTTEAKARLDRIQSVLKSRSSDASLPDESVADALSSPVITKLRDQYLDTQKRATEWAARYGPKHEAVISLNNELLALQNSTWSELARIAETYKSTYTVAHSREDSIERRLTEVFQEAGSSRQSQVQLRELETSANTYKNIYENFLDRYTQAVQQQSFPSTEARIITFAVIGSKTSPKTTLVLALTLMFGMASGFGVALLQDKFGRVVHTRDQLVRLLGADCIATIPRVVPKNGEVPRRGGLGGSGRLLKGLLPFRRRSASRPHKPPIVLFNAQEPFTPLAEALRNIKVAIDIRRIAHVTRSIAFVSALPSEGKSTIAASVAALIAGTGRRVLLLDCDMRNPSLTRSLDTDQENGLIEVLYGQVSLSDAAFRSNLYKFDFLGGPKSSRPTHTADILASEAMAMFLRDAKERYDYIIVDLPPLLPVVDARASAHLFDTFALVTEWGATTVDELEKAMNLSPVIRDRLLGIVLNKVNKEEMRRFEGYTGVESRYYYK